MFDVDAESPIAVTPGPAPDANSGIGVSKPTPPRLQRVAPKLRQQDPPPYPSIAVRNNEQGLTGLEVCVDVRGRVTAASLVSSSGHVSLDEAALRWVRQARFAPGTVDGAAQDVCGHGIVYEWNLKDARP